MKKLIALAIVFIAFTALVVMPPGNTIKAYEYETIKTLECDLVNIVDINYEITQTMYPVMIMEVGISPYYNFEGVNYTEFSKYNYISNDDTYALYDNFDNPIMEAKSCANMFYATIDKGKVNYSYDSYDNHFRLDRSRFLINNEYVKRTISA